MSTRQLAVALVLAIVCLAGVVLLDVLTHRDEWDDDDDEPPAAREAAQVHASARAARDSSWDSCAAGGERTAAQT